MAVAEEDPTSTSSLVSPVSTVDSPDLPLPRQGQVGGGQARAVLGAQRPAAGGHVLHEPAHWTGSTLRVSAVLTSVKKIEYFLFCNRFKCKYCVRFTEL